MTEMTFREWLAGRIGTIEEVSKVFGVTTRTIHKWKNGDPVSPKNAREVSEITGIPVESLIFGKGK